MVYWDSVINKVEIAFFRIVLREFQSYITSHDNPCVAATIQAIGRCASAIEEITDACLNGLVQLLSNQDQVILVFE